MYYKLCNSTDVECLEIDISRLKGKIFKDEYKMLCSVLDKVRENVEILSENYGENRDSEKSLGGYVLLCTSTMEEDVLQKVYERYGISEEEYEYEDIIARNSGLLWKCTCYIVSADYGIVIIRPIAITDNRRYILGM